MKKLILLSCVAFLGHSANTLVGAKEVPPVVPEQVVSLVAGANNLLSKREVTTLPTQYWYDFYAKFMDLNRTVAILTETNERQKKNAQCVINRLSEYVDKVAQLEKEKKALEAICAAIPKTSTPISGWCYYEPLGWVYQHKDASPWFFINTPDYKSMGYNPNFEMHGWCFLDTSSEEILVYCYFTKKWHRF